MGKIMLPCNLTVDEQAKAWKLFDQYLTEEESDQIMELGENYLFVETLDKTHKRCVCTHPGCGAQIYKKGEIDIPLQDVFKHKHRESMECPMCGRRVTVQNLGRLKSFQTINRDPQTRFTVCRAAQNGALLLLSGYASRFYSEDDLKPVLDVGWKAFTYLEPGKRQQWKNDWVGNPCEVFNHGWIRPSSVMEPFNVGFYGFYNAANAGDSWIINSEEIQKTKLKYSQMESWLWSDSAGDIDTDPVRGAVKYLSAYTQYPNLEMAVKIGLIDAANDLVDRGVKNFRDLDWNAKKLQDFLRISKQDCNAFMHCPDRSLQLLNWYHQLTKKGETKSMEKFIDDMKATGCIRNIEAVLEAAELADVPLQKAVRYLAKPNSVKIWKDYLDMAKDLAYDLDEETVKMPKNLQERHDQAVETIRARKQMEVSAQNREQEEAFAKQTEKMQKMYEFTYKGLSVIVPTTIDQIVAEGKTLHHCVGGYAGRHFSGYVTILFIRHQRKPETSYITMEIQPRKKYRDPVKIVQVHGYRNEGYRRHDIGWMQEKMGWFLNAWQAWVEAGSKRDKDGNPVLENEEEKTA